MYTTTLLIEDDDDTSVSGTQSYIEDIGQLYAPQYGPNGTYTLPPADLAQIIWDECHRYATHVTHFAATVAQMIHETAGFQSEYWRERWNPGGIGAINSNPDLAIRFDSPRAGVRAHIAHLLVYSAGTNGPWKADDPRWSNVVAKGWDGAATRWVHLNGKWAYPGTSYGQTIISMANKLRAVAGTGGAVAEPQIIRRILPRDASNTPKRTMDWDWITVHNTANPTPGADALNHAAYLEGLAKAGKKEPSWGYTVDDTRIVQHLEDDQCGWHASDDDGPGNFDSIGIELVEIGNQEQVMRHAAWLIAKKLKSKNKGAEWVKQHNHFARDKKNCPRLLRANNGAGWNRLIQMVQSNLGDVQPVPPGPPPMPQTAPDPRGSGFWLPLPFLHRIEQDDWLNTGVIVSEAFIEGNQIVQYSERRRFELSADNSVTLGLVGQEAMWAKYPERKPT